MNRPKDSQERQEPGARTAAGAAGSDDERLLDHHLEELLGALSAASRRELQASPDEFA